MKLTDTLTKDNFWNALKEQYPNSMKCFCDWIDDYKQSIKWNELFNFGTPHYSKQGWHDPKFHDLPYDMQVGIWIRFAEDKLNELFEQPEYTYSGDLEEDIKTVFS